MIFLKEIFSILSIISIVYSQDDYCDLICIIDGMQYMHTVCSRKDVQCQPGPACRNFERAPFTDSERKMIEDKHNELRNRVATGSERRGGGQPPAANMRALRYNSELEFIATCSANTCKFNHDKCRKTHKLEVGQNIASVGMSRREDDPNLYINHHLKMIQDWYGEVESYDSSFIDHHGQNKGSPVGHYTQLVWADIEYVGCGRSIYEDGGFKTIFFVCNYGGTKSGGNTLNWPVYLKGPACSQCPSGTKCSSQWPGLCAYSELRRLPDFITNVILKEPIDEATIFGDETDSDFQALKPRKPSAIERDQRTQMPFNINFNIKMKWFLNAIKKGNDEY